MSFGEATRLGTSLVLAMALAGCANGDSLVVVTIDASPPLANVALLRTTSMAGGLTIGHDFTDTPPSLGGGMTTTFGVQVPSSIGGPFSIHVEADDATGNLLASGDGATTLARGKRVDLLMTLGESSGDMGGTTVDLGGATADMNGNTCVVSTDTFDDGCTFAP